MDEFRWNSLHAITRLLLFATLARLVGDTLFLLRDMTKHQEGSMSLGDLVSTTAHAYAYSMLFVGSAATVELLYRIWRELRALRLSGVGVVAEAAEPATEES